MPSQLRLLQEVYLLATAPHLSSPLPRERIQTAISAYVNQVAKGNAAAFARLVRNCSRERVKQWLLGKAIPQLSSILPVCYYLEVSLVDFLTGEVIGAVADRLVTALPERRRPPSSTTRKRLDFDGMRATLLAALNESPPPSCFEVRRRLRESPYGGNPYRYCPDLCHAISSRYADYKKAKYLGEIRLTLETVLESNNSPPPSLMEVARPLKYRQKELYKYFPDLCHAISARYLSYRKVVRMERIEKLRQDVRQAALELHSQGVKPHSGNVNKLLNKPVTMRDQEAQIALREVQRDLGYEK